MVYKIDTVNNLSNDKSLLQAYHTLSGNEKLSNNFYVVPDYKKDEFVKSMTDKESHLSKWRIAGVLFGGIICGVICKNVPVKAKLEWEGAALGGVLGAMSGCIPAVIYDNKLTKKILQNCNAEKV